MLQWNKIFINPTYLCLPVIHTTVFKFPLTNSICQNLSWEIDSSSANQETSHILWNPNTMFTRDYQWTLLWTTWIQCTLSLLIPSITSTTAVDTTPVYTQIHVHSLTHSHIHTHTRVRARTHTLSLSFSLTFVFLFFQVLHAQGKISSNDVWVTEPEFSEVPVMSLEIPWFEICQPSIETFLTISVLIIGLLVALSRWLLSTMYSRWSNVMEFDNVNWILTLNYIDLTHPLEGWC